MCHESLFFVLVLYYTSSNTSTYVLYFEQYIDVCIILRAILDNWIFLIRNKKGIHCQNFNFIICTHAGIQNTCFKCNTIIQDEFENKNIQKHLPYTSGRKTVDSSKKKQVKKDGPKIESKLPNSSAAFQFVATATSLSTKN